MDESLTALASVVCGKSGAGSPAHLDALLLLPTPEDLMRFKALEHTPLRFLQARFALLKFLNRLVCPLLDYVDVRHMAEDHGAEEEGEEQDTDGQQETWKQRFDAHSLSYVVHDLRGLYWLDTKRSVLDSLLDSSRTALPGHARGMAPAHNRPRVHINRHKASRAKENPARDPDGMQSLFGQLFSQLRSVPYRQFRVAKNEQCFSVNFMGEGSIDVGGPYRDALSQLCSELMSDTLRLFLRAPNRRNDVGMNREKWLVNPDASSPTMLAQFEFLGALMGVALRTQQPLTLDLPTILWKRLLGQAPDSSDLEAVDKVTTHGTNKRQKVKHGTD